MGRIRLLVADEEVLFRECVCAVLRTCLDFEVIAEASGGEETVAMVRHLAPDVVMMNLAMAVLDGYRTVHLVRMANEHVRLLLITQNEDREWVIGGLKTKADGYISRHTNTAELISAVWTVYRGEYFLQPSIAKTIVEDYTRMGQPSNAPDRLTTREKMVLEMLAEGQAKDDIARSLHIAPGTVLSIRARIKRKQGVSAVK